MKLFLQLIFIKMYSLIIKYFFVIKTCALLLAVQYRRHSRTKPGAKLFILYGEAASKEYETGTQGSQRILLKIRRALCLLAHLKCFSKVYRHFARHI